MNIQRAQIQPEKMKSFFDSQEYLALQADESCRLERLDEIVNLIASAKRPVILAGGGVRTAQASAELQTLVETTGIPVVSSLMGLDAVSHDNQEFMGMIGSYGNRYSNLTLANCDFLLILGSRLDSRQTGTRPDTFARAATKVHVDIDPIELQAKVQVDIALRCHIKPFLQALNEKLAVAIKPDIAEWLRVIDGYRQKYPTRMNPAESSGIDPNLLMETLSAIKRRLSPGCGTEPDVGQSFDGGADANIGRHGGDGVRASRSHGSGQGCTRHNGDCHSR
jgi:acetolactate synthase-1/2/3 large subunit